MKSLQKYINKKSPYKLKKLEWVNFFTKPHISYHCVNLPFIWIQIEFLIFPTQSKHFSEPLCSICPQKNRSQLDKSRGLFFHYQILTKKVLLFVAQFKPPIPDCLFMRYCKDMQKNPKLWIWLAIKNFRYTASVIHNKQNALYVINSQVWDFF